MIVFPVLKSLEFGITFTTTNQIVIIDAQYILCLLKRKRENKSFQFKPRQSICSYYSNNFSKHSKQENLDLLFREIQSSFKRVTRSSNVHYKEICLFRIFGSQSLI